MSWQRDKPVQRRGYKKGGVVLPEVEQHRLISTSPQTPNLVFKGTTDKAMNIAKRVVPRMKLKKGGVMKDTVDKAMNVVRGVMRK
jgi:hypothetical protein